MADLNVNLSNAIKSVGGTSQKNINNNTGRPNRSLENAQRGQGGRISADIINPRGIDPSVVDKIKNIRENAVKTLNTDIVEKALKDADIEITQETLNIVKSLVNGSLPLTDKNIANLLEYSRAFKTASVDTIALMMRLEIPITAENIEQFEKLIGANENLSDKINELIDKLPREILQNSRNFSEFSSVLSKLLDIVSNNLSNSSNSSKLNNSGNISEINIESVLNKTLSQPQTQIQQPQQLSNDPTVLNNTEIDSLLNILKALKAPENILNRIINTNSPTQNPPANIGENMENINNFANLPKSDVILNIINEFIQNTGENIQESPIQNNTEILSNQISNNNNQINNPEAAETKFVNIPVTANNAAAADSVFVFAKAEDSEIFDYLKDLINNGGFQKLLKESMGEKMLINAKNFKFSPEQLEDFYNNLNEKLNNIEKQFEHIIRTNQNLQAAARENGVLPQAYLDAKNIRDNLSLIHEINKTMPFLQIPVKLPNGTTINSDLYVFANKKKKKSAGNTSGSLNALLRMDLENAGTLDVYLRLSGKNVQSRFHSDNIKSLGEIEKNLPELDETINKLGFNFKSTVSSENKGFDFLSDFINRGIPKAEIRKYILNLKI